MFQKRRPRIYGIISLEASKEYTVHALESFFRSTRIAAGDMLILILNDEHTVPIPETLAPVIKTITHETPASFAKNANLLRDLALKHFADLYILNNDIIFTPDWAELLHVEQAAITIPLCNQDKQYASGDFELKRAMDLSEYLPHQKTFHELVAAHRKKHSGVLPIFFAPFFCVRIPHILLETIGTFNEEYGIGGGEDTDYTLRTHLQGYALLQPQSCYLLHFMGKSTWRGPESPEEVETRDNRYREVFIKNWGEKLTKYLIDQDESVLTDSDFNADSAQWRTFVNLLKKEDFEPTLPKLAGFLYCDRHIKVKLKTLKSVASALDHLNVVAAPGINTQVLQRELSTLSIPADKISLAVSSESELTLANTFSEEMLRKRIEYTFFIDKAPIAYTAEVLREIKLHLLLHRPVQAWYVGTSAGNILTVLRNDSRGIRAPERANTNIAMRLPLENWISTKEERAS